MTTSRHIIDSLEIHIDHFKQFRSSIGEICVVMDMFVNTWKHQIDTSTGDLLVRTINWEWTDGKIFVGWVTQDESTTVNAREYLMPHIKGVTGGKGPTEDPDDAYDRAMKGI